MIVTKNTCVKKEFYLVFSNGLGNRWWLCDGYRHVYIVMHDNFNWLEINPTFTFLKITILPHNITDNVPKLIRSLNGVSTILKVTVNDRGNKNQLKSLIGVRSCVEMVKYVMGVKLPCLTPAGLFKCLIKMKERHRYRHNIDFVDYIY